SLPAPLVRKTEGSSLVFRSADGRWLKLSPPFFGDSLATEVEITPRLAGRLPVPVPDILEHGALKDWGYLVSAEVPGVQIEAVLDDLDGADLERIATELGAFMRVFHEVSIPGFERSFGPWDRYLEGALADPRRLHASRGTDGAAADRIAVFLERWAPALRALGPPVLVHADLTAEHVMVSQASGRWSLCGVLDLADAMKAPAELDLMAPFIELFRSRGALQRRLAEEAGAWLPDDPAQRAELVMALALQHRFMHFHDWFAKELALGVTAVEDIARAVFPL
ncbi:MAG: phosphotransferase family protein, partial [Caulobacteraceae bacterium]